PGKPPPKQTPPLWPPPPTRRGRPPRRGGGPSSGGGGARAGAPYQIWQVACRSSSFSLPPHVCAGMSSD
ncbi:hypothetical protein EJ653_17695, partial [Pseudomonas aeruginosa]